MRGNTLERYFSNMKTCATGKLNLSEKDLEMSALLSEISVRNSFTGELDFTGAKFSDELPSLRGTYYDVTTYLNVSTTDYVDEIRTELYNNKKGMTLIRAVTGFGKSTRFPRTMFELRPNDLILVVEPNDIIARSTYEFVSIGNKFVYYMDPRYKGQLPDRGIMYASATSLLCYIVRNGTIDSYNIVLQIDESHTATEEYLTLYMLVAHGVLRVNKTLLTSATHKGNLNNEERADCFHIYDRPHTVEYDYNSESLEEFIRMQILDPKGIMCTNNLAPRTMIFLPDEDLCKYARRLYEEEAVKCKCITRYSSYEDLLDAKRFLGNSQTEARRVLLTTSILETGITLPVDAVIDLSLDCETIFLSTANTFVKNYRGISEGEAFQRRGRCGRICVGTYHYIENWRHGVDEIEKAGLMSIMLWFSLFGFNMPKSQTPDEVIEILGPLRPRKAALMLASGFHPMYLLPYFDVDGFLYSNCLNTFKRLFPTLNVTCGEEYLEMTTCGWNRVSLTIGTSVVETYIPFHIDSYMSILNVILGIDIQRNGTLYNENNYVSEDQQYSNFLDRVSTYNELDYLRNSRNNMIDMQQKSSLDMLSSKRNVKKIINDSGFGSFNDGVRANYGNNSKFSKFPDNESTITSGSKGMTEEDVKRILTGALKDFSKELNSTMMNVNAPKEDLRSKPSGREREVIDKYKVIRTLDVRKLPQDLLIMPLGCLKMKIVVDGEGTEFVQKLLSGKDGSKYMADKRERMKRFEQICAYFNTLKTKLGDKDGTYKHKKRTTKVPKAFRWATELPSLKNEIEMMRSEKEALEEILPNWRRWGLNLIPYVHGDVTLWDDDAYDMILLNDFLRRRSSMSDVSRSLSF